MPDPRQFLSTWAKELIAENLTFSELRLSEEKSNLMFCLGRNLLVLVFEQRLKHLFFEFCSCCVCECACVPIHNSYFVGDLSLPVTCTSGGGMRRSEEAGVSEEAVRRKGARRSEKAKVPEEG